MDIDLGALDPFGERFGPEDHAYFRQLEKELATLTPAARKRRIAKFKRLVDASRNGRLPLNKSVEWVCLIERVDPWTAADMIVKKIVAGEIRYVRVKPDA